MTWTAGADKSTGDIILPADWNNYFGATGSLEYLADRELWIPATQWTNTATPVALSSLGDFPVVSLATVNDYGRISFRVPTDFASIITAALVFVLNSAGFPGPSVTVTTDYGADGQAYNTHSGSSVISAPSGTNPIHVGSISGALGNLAANDNVGITAASDNPITLLGLYFKYAIG